MKTKLEAYTLWWDGIIEVSPESLYMFISKGMSSKNIAVSEMTPDIERYNQFELTPIKTKDSLDIDLINFDWQLPEPYKSLDIDDYISNTIIQLIDKDDMYDVKVNRLMKELDHFETDYPNLLRCIIYIVQKFKDNNIVYGVGRGSSCASYLLFLIGLHSVDPIKYNIPISEFFR